MSNENKTKFSIRVDTELVRLLDANLESGNARSRTELIEDALKFYLSYLTSGKIENYLLKSLSSVTNGAIRDTENRIARLLYKLTVSVDMLTHMIAYEHGLIDDGTVSKLRAMSVESVNRTNGVIDLGAAVRFQNAEGKGE